MTAHPSRRPRKKRKKKSEKGVSKTPDRELSSSPDAMTSETFEIRSKITKVDEELGLVFGWAIICTEDGEPYFDLQKDHALEKAMVKAVTGFMQNSRDVSEMHSDGSRGTVVHSMPMTAEIAEAFGIVTKITGWMIAMAPDEAMLAKFKSGELSGFSIGGRRLRDRIVLDEAA